MENKLQSNIQKSKDFKEPIFLDEDTSFSPVPTFYTTKEARESVMEVMEQEEKASINKASKLQSKS
ncbi:TPA: hypothetical protein ACX6PF_002419 [Photobacterium damselae]